MSQLVKKIRTSSGDCQIDYNALANRPIVSNPNMLINGDFKINQRGQDTYTATNTWKYSVDRWKYIGAMTVSVNSSGTVTISKENNVDSTYFAQSCENTGVLGPYTLSFEVKSIVGTMNVYIEGGSDPLMEVTQKGIYTIHSSKYANSVIFRLDGYPTTVELAWVKLERGDIPTMFSSRGIGEELQLCHRYFNVVRGVRVLGVEQNYEAKTFTYIIPNVGIMRAEPIISLHGLTNLNSIDGICVRGVGCSIIDNFTFTYHMHLDSLIVVAKSSVTLTEMCYATQLFVSDECNICLDAEIY